MKTLADIFGVKIEKDMVKKRPMRVEDIDCSSRLEKYFKEHNGKVKHGNNKMREEFEKLPEIATRLSEYDIVFHDNDYVAEGYSDNTKLWIALGFVSGAWYAFQEQQKKVDKAIKIIEEYQAENIEIIEKVYEVFK